MPLTTGSLNYSASNSTSGGKAPENTALQPLDACGFDRFECDLLPILRHFLQTYKTPDQASWQLAYDIALERWGEGIGFPIAHGLAKIIRALFKLSRADIAFQDPLAIDARAFISLDEEALLAMLHNMRRDNTPAAREAVEILTQGIMDPALIRAGLEFSNRFPNGAEIRKKTRMPPSLRVV